MIISVASGKGGTGKTTIAASLTMLGKSISYFDCDAEEPNGHLFLNPILESQNSVFKKLPEINYNICTLCRECVKVCEFNAMINFKTEILIIEEMCHSCGACSYFCPHSAIKEKEIEIGKINHGKTETGQKFYSGILNIGEMSAVSIISEIIKKAKNDASEVKIIDSPPGTSCSMVEAVRDSDYCILVTESSPYGLNDLILAIDVLKKLKVPFGIIVNKYDESFKEMEDYLLRNRLEILLKIPFSKQYAENYSKGILPIFKDDKLKADMQTVLQNIKAAKNEK